MYVLPGLPHRSRTAKITAPNLNGMNDSMTSLKVGVLSSVVNCLLLTGYASAGPPGSMDVVRPGPAIANRMGQLIVYTATDEFRDGDDTWAYPHSSYFIYRPDGSRYQYVANHISRSDSQPDTVDLPSGQYYIVAEADFSPRIRVPVKIVPGRTTTVNLEHGIADRVPADADQNSIIRAADGTVIGWTTAR